MKQCAAGRPVPTPDGRTGARFTVPDRRGNGPQNTESDSNVSYEKCVSFLNYFLNMLLIAEILKCQHCRIVRFSLDMS